MSPSLPFLHDPQGVAPEGDEDKVRKIFYIKESRAECRKFSSKFASWPDL